MAFMQDLNAGQVHEQMVCDVLLGRYLMSKAERTDDSFSHLIKCRRDIIRFQKTFGDLRVKDKFDNLYYIELKTDGTAYSSGNLFLEEYSDTGERTGNVTDGWIRDEQPNCRITHYIFKLKHRESQSLIVRYGDLRQWYQDNNHRFKSVPMRYDQEQLNRSTGLLAPIGVLLKEIDSCHLIDLTEVK